MAGPATGVPASFVHVLRARAAEQPDDLAFRFLTTGDVDGPCETLTFGALDRRARSIAAHLVDRGLAGQPAILLFPPGLEFAATFFGCLHAGVIAVPAYPPDPRRLDRTLGRLMGIVGDAGAHVVLTDRQIDGLRHLAVDQAPDHAEALGALEWIVTESLDITAADVWVAPDLPADRPAMLQYTSGSTGDPRGVVLGHDNLLANQALIRECFGHEPEVFAGREGEPGVAWLPLFHDMGLVGHVLHPVYLGVTSVLMSPLHFLQRPLRWLEAVSAFRAHTSGGPSFAYDLCLRHVTEEDRDRLDLSGWEVAYCGAEPVRAGTARRFADYFAPAGFRRGGFLPCYGLAEATLLVTGAERGRAPAARSLDARALEEGRVESRPPGQRGTRTVVSCGPARGDAVVRIVDPVRRESLGEGTVGEVWIAGRSVARGYWSRQTLSEETFGATLDGEQATPYLRSGDLGFLWRGELYITGRLKELIVVHGRNHYPADVEATVEDSHPGIRPGCCAAFGLPAEGGEQLALVAEFDAARDGDEPGVVISRIRQAVEQEHGLRAYAITLVPPRALPKTSSGKPQRHACRTALLRGDLEVVAGRSFDPGRATGRTGAAEPPALEARPATVRRWLTGRLARAAGVERSEIDPDAPLSTFGLGSLTLVEITGELSVALGRPLPTTLFYDHPSVGAVALHVTSAASGAESRRQGPPRPTPGAAAEPIAVVGVACRLPGDVEDPDDLWDLLEGGRDALTEVPADRWDIDAYHDPTGEVPGKMACRRGGFVEGIDRFDPRFFGMSLGEAPAVDPQQRLLMETCWRALEGAGQTREALAGSNTGVYVGLCGTEYGYQVMTDERAIDAYSLLGTAHSAMVGRLSYWLGLEGPNFPVDTACSSSLVAVHLACQGLRGAECDLALAAGVNVLLTPAGTIYFTRLGALSPDGVCRPFDADANGYVRGEGCGAVVLKRLSDARRDGDSILGLIRGSAVNQDGRSVGFTAPSGAAQQRVIGRALAMAGLEPGQIDYVEAHGTGTPVGDPIEINALGELMRGARDRPLLVGSVKSNIGHLEGGAGIASLIKALMMLRHDRVVPSLHFDEPNPRVRWDELPIRVARGGEEWGRAGRPKVVGVNAFGFSGTNAHVVVEQWRETDGGEAAPREPPRPAYLVPVSAHDRDTLGVLRADLRDHLEGDPDGDLADLAWTLGARRSHLTHRVAAVASTAGELAAALVPAGGAPPGRRAAPAPPGEPGGVTFLFTGQGAQAPGMGRRLYDGHPVYRDALDDAVAALDPHLERPLLPAILGEVDDAERLHHTATTQPALFALEVALARVWMSAGVRPDLLIGHSVGEVAAACVAGVLSLADAARLVAARGRLMGDLPTGAMIAVSATEARVEAALARSDAGPVSIAALNTPGQTVISGPGEAVLALGRALEERGIETARLRVSHAFHSPMMDPMLPAFREICGELSYHQPSIPIVGNVRGTRAGDEIATPDYWVEHARATVRFADGIRCAADEGATTFVEIGPRPVLSALAAECLEPATGATWIPALRPPRDDWQVLLGGLGALYTQGRSLDWSQVNGADPGGRPKLPAYPFQRSRHWIGRKTAGEDLVAVGPPGDHALSGRPLRLFGAGIHRVLDVSLDRQPYLRDHVIHGVVVLPGTFFVATLIAVAADHFHARGGELRDVEFLRPVAVGDGVRIHVVLTAEGDPGRLRFRVGSCPVGVDEDRTEVCAQGRLLLNLADPDRGYGLDLETSPRFTAACRPCTESLEVGDLYRSLSGMGIDLGPSWRWTRSLSRHPTEAQAVARLDAPEGTAPGQAPFHPAQLDNVLAAGMAAVAGEAEGIATPRLPVAIDSVWWGDAAKGPLSCHGIHRGTDGETSAFDIQVADEWNCVLLHIEGFRARRAPRQVFLDRAGLRPPPPLLRLRWEPLGPVDIGQGPSTEPGVPASIRVFEPGVEPTRAMQVARTALEAARSAGGDPRDARAIWVTQGAVAVRDDEDPDLATSVVWGLGRSWASEETAREIRLIDLPADTPDEARLPSVHAVLAAAGDERQVALRGGQVHVPRLSRMSFGPASPPDGGGATAVVTGGFGYLGRLVARHLVEELGFGGLLLIGRGEPGTGAHGLAEELRGAGTPVGLARADVADAGQLRDALAAATDLPPLSAVVHAAGVLDDAPLAGLDEERLAAVLAPKVLGAWNLHRATEDLDLRLFALFSSIAAPLGSPGQGAYAAANEFLAALAHHRRARGLVAHAIDWGPWAGGGMAARSGAGTLRRMRARGIHPLDPARALSLFSHAVGRDVPRQAIADLDLDDMARAVPAHRLPPPLRTLVAGDGPPGEGAAPPVAAELARLDGEERRARLTELLRREVAAVIAVADPREVPLDRPLQALGLDSLTGAELRSRLAQATGVELPLRALFENPTIDGLAGYLAEGRPWGRPSIPVPSEEEEPRGTEAPAEGAPLSSGQRRLWFLDRLSPRKELYHVHLELEGRGPVDLDALKRTLTILVDRHPSLRTCFPEIDGEPRQVILPPGEVELRRVDLTHLTEGEARSRLDELRRDQTEAPFDLNREAPVRFGLVRLQPDLHRLSITQHHIVTDGWSLVLLVRQLAYVYSEFEEGRDPVLLGPAPEAMTPFDAENRALAGGQRRAGLAFWTEKLADLPILDLPTDRARPARRSYRGGQVAFRWPRSVSSRILELGSSSGATPFATVASLFAILLSRLAHQRDLALGTVHANRPDGDGRGVMGFFVNTVVLRCDLFGEPDIREVFRRVARTTAEALDHGAVPFDEVVRAVAPGRRGEDNPLFRVCVVQETPVESASTGKGLAIQPVREALDGSVPGTAKFDLTLMFAVDDGRIHGSLEYSADLFDEATVQRFADDLRGLAVSAVWGAEEPVTALPLQAAVDPGAGPDGETAVLQDSPRGSLVHRWFHERAALAPDRIALRGDIDAITFGDLARRANRIARLLRSRGVGPDRPVGLFMERSPDRVAAMLGILGAGGAYVPLDTENPRTRLRAMIEDAGLDVAVTRSDVRDSVPDGIADLLDLDDLEHELAALDDTPPDAAVGPDHLAYVMFTSGSTGRPKGACVTHANLANYMAWKVRTFPPEPGDRFLHKTPVGFDSSVGEIWYPLVTGTELVLARPGGQRDPEYLVAAIRDHRITMFKAVPSQYRAMLLAGGFDRCTSLRWLFSGGEELSAALAMDLKWIVGARVVNLYGPAEATVSATWHEVDDEQPGARVPIGRPIDNVSVALLDEGGIPVPVGSVGEIHLGGGGVSRGYLNRPDLTAERFTPERFDEPDGAKTYRTGDLARWRTPGTLEFVGRRDRQVQLRGQRIELGEVEAALDGLPGVVGSAVILEGDDTTTRRLVGYVEGGGPLDEAALRDRLAQRLLPAMVPSRLVVLDALPRLPGGKVDRAALPDPPAPATGPPTPPRTPTERALAQVFARVLELDGVGIDDDFFALGGHSLLAVRAMVEVQERFPGRVALNDLFRAPTVEALARRIDRGKTPESGESGDLERRLRRQVRLPQDVVPERAAPMGPGLPRRFLLTGATGFLGAHLLRELLTAQEEPVTCLVRGSDSEAARARVVESARTRGLWRDGDESRVQVVCGDLTRRAFGLDPGAFEALADGTDAVIHAGAWVHHAHGFGTLRGANVGGTLDVIRLACTGRRKPVVFVSTLDVFPRGRGSEGPVWAEELSPDAPPPVHSGYAQSKWVAERCLGLAAERGLPVTIVRPGLILGHGETGRIEAPDSWLVLLLQACVRLGRLPAGVLPDLRMVPVDRAARAIAVRSLDAAAGIDVLHLTHPEPLSGQALERALEGRGFRLERVAYGEWRGALDAALTGEADEPLVRLAALLPPSEEALGVAARRPVEDRRGGEAMETTGGALPSAARQLDANLRHLIDSGQLPRPRATDEEGDP